MAFGRIAVPAWLGSGSHRKVRLLDSDIEGSATFETSGNVDSMTQCKLPEDVMFL